MKDGDTFSERTKNLSPAKRALLELRLKKQQKLHPQIPPLVPQLRSEPTPLSFAQQRLWFLHQWNPTSTQYSLVVAYRLTGSLQIEALQRTIDTLVERHESLRTTFSLEGETPHQHIQPAQSGYLSILKLSPEEKERGEARAMHLLQEEVRKPFDLSQGPLFRPTLIQIAPEDHILILVLHHIITDGWSMQILYKELSLLYRDFAVHKPSSLSPLPIQYPDFAIWQRTWLQGEVLNNQLIYWKNQLRGMPPYLEILSDLPRPPIQSHKGAARTITLPAQLTKALHRISQEQGCTLFMTLLTAFKVLLSRYTGQSDIVIGSPIANRTQQELEGVIGFFVNTLALRTKIHNNLTFCQLLGQVQKVCLDAYTHQDLPFEKLVEELHPPRDPSRSPLIQILFQVQNATSPPTTFPELEVKRLKIATTTSKMDLNFSIVEHPEGLTGHMEYDTALYQERTIIDLLAHFQILLDGIVNNPDQMIAELPLLSTDEGTTITEVWNATIRPYPHDCCIHQLFDSQVAQTPEAIAVICNHEQITYRQLQSLATLLGHHLQQLGVQVESRVGLYVERSLETIIGILGILKAGGTYVPLDPTYPTERLAYMIRDAEIDIILTQGHLRDTLLSILNKQKDVSHRTIHVLSLDSDWILGLDLARPFHVPHTQPQILAYVIYTSGSTGQPKGVEVSHAAVARLVFGQEYIPFSDKEVFLQLASLSFDAATLEIWGSLLHGARLVLWPNQTLSVDTIKEVLQEHQISTLWLTAALFHQMVDQQLQGFHSIKYLLTGGDVVSPSKVQRTFELLNHTTVINAYGPTENTTFTTCYVMKTKDHVHQRALPIGQPIANSQVLLLDRNQRLVPIRIPGELYIGGAGLARGYLNQPILTAERFIPHAWSNQPGSRLYKSGDQGRYQEDGTIEFLGRRDYQVKIRGFRIELGEIETALNTHSAVQESLALAVEDSTGDKRLVAYLVTLTENQPTVGDLRHFLADIIPSYMIPNTFIFLEAFPITSNGKIDRAQLPTVEETPVSSQSYRAPRNSIETQIVTTWETIFGRHPIGVNDNFFDLGGESLLAVRLCAELEKSFPGKVSIPMIFQSQTIEQLAKIIQGETERAPWKWLIPIQTKGWKPPVFCVLFGATFSPYVQEFSTQPLYMLINQGHDGKPIVHKTVEEIAAQYIKEIKTVQLSGPYYLAGYSFGGLVAYEMAQQLIKHGEQVVFLGLVDPTTPPQKPKGSTGSEKLTQLLKATTLPEKRTIIYKLQNFSRITSIIFSGIRWRLHALTNKNTWREKLQNIACQFWFNLGYPLPASLRRFYRTKYNKQASRWYKPQTYPESITIFQTSSRPEIFWGALSQKPIQAHQLSGDHLNTVEEPHVHTLLTKFLDALNSIDDKKTNPKC